MYHIHRNLLNFPGQRIISVFAVFLFLSQSTLFAQIKSSSFYFEGHQRNYKIFLPHNYSVAYKLPLVIYLHSYGWTAQQGMNYTSLNQVADTSDFIVAYPDAIPNWNSGIADNPDFPTPNIDDVAFINALIDTLNNHYSINLERVYACGYSNGGFMSHKLACRLSNRIAAIASVGGVISTKTSANCNSLRAVPVLQIHGTEDPWVPLSGNKGWNSADQTVNFWVNVNHCLSADTIFLSDIDTTDGCKAEKISYSNSPDKIRVIYYKVINGGHTWPGAGPTGYPAGKTNQDFNANSVIWNFFKHFKLHQ